MTEPSTSTASQDHFHAISEEIKGCDRCYHRYYRLGQAKSDGFKIRKKRGKPGKNDKPPILNSTGGLLLESGDLGQNILDLSLNIHECGKINGKKRLQSIEEGFVNINGCDQYLENIKSAIEETLIQRIEMRIDGIMNGISDERKKAEDSIKEKFRIRKDILENRSKLQVQNLRRQLDADIDFEEKDAQHRSEIIKKRKLKEIENSLKKLGCSDDFSVKPKQIDILESEIVEVHTPGFQGTVMFPINPKDDDELAKLERKELQNFLLYARAPVRVGKRHKHVETPIKIEQVPLNGSLLFGPLTDLEL